MDLRRSSVHNLDGFRKYVVNLFKKNEEWSNQLLMEDYGGLSNESVIYLMRFIDDSIEGYSLGFERFGSENYKGFGLLTFQNDSDQENKKYFPVSKNTVFSGVIPDSQFIKV